MNSSGPQAISEAFDYDIAVGHQVGSKFQVAGDVIADVYGKLPDFPTSAAGAGFALAGAKIAQAVAAIQSHGIKIGEAVQAHGDGIHTQTTAFTTVDEESGYVFGGQH